MGKYDNLAALARGSDEAGDAVRSVIRAYHGSPYDFDRFDASKIGTGEGAQAYGHGLYFAGREDVARSYRDSLKDMVDLPVPDELDSRLRQVISEIGQLAGQRGKFVGGEWDAIQKQLDQKQNLLIELQHQYRSAARNPGHMYEVEIGQPEEAMLDWDRSLADQQHLLPQVERAINKIPDPEARYDNMLAIEDPGSFKGKEVYGVLRNSLGGDVAASRALLDSGVPGMRYLDGPSRSSAVLIDAGSRNTLMFPGTEDSIRILRKYAVPGAVGTGVASQYEESP